MKNRAHCKSWLAIRYLIEKKVQKFKIILHGKDINLENVLIEEMTTIVVNDHHFIRKKCDDLLTGCPVNIEKMTDLFYETKSVTDQ
jgi:hypothetical protein